MQKFYHVIFVSTVYIVYNVPESYASFWTLITEFLTEYYLENISIKQLDVDPGSPIFSSFLHRFYLHLLSIQVNEIIRLRWHAEKLRNWFCTDNRLQANMISSWSFNEEISGTSCYQDRVLKYQALLVRGTVPCIEFRYI